MNYILHDMPAEYETELMMTLPNEIWTVINAHAPAARCTGCFKCWLKHPGYCTFSDKLKWIGKEIITSEEFIIICKGLYGGFPPNVKRLIDRMIPGVLPFFRKENNELHHSKRFPTGTRMKIIFYNSDEMTAEEKEQANRLVAAMSLNFHAKEYTVTFVNGLNSVLKMVQT